MSFTDRKTGTLTRALIMNGQVSLALLDTSAVARKAALRHRIAGNALVALGNTLTAAGYLSGWLKDEKSALSVSVSGTGGKICVSGDGGLALRGYASGCEEGLGEGTLSVIRDDGQGLPFAGTVPLVSESMEENFTRYFEESEQLPTCVALLTEERAGEIYSGGVFLQPLPSATEEVRRFAKEEILACRELLKGHETDKILTRYTAQACTARNLSFTCRCSFKKAESLIFAMGKESALALCKEQGALTVHCDYCNTDYSFDEAKLLTLFSVD